jgi:hypothetical protein
MTLSQYRKIKNHPVLLDGKSRPVLRLLTNVPDEAIIRPVNVCSPGVPELPSLKPPCFTAERFQPKGYNVLSITHETSKRA